MVACVRPPLGRAPVPPLGLPIQSTTSTIFYYYHYCWKYINDISYHAYVLTNTPPSTSCGNFLYLIPLAPLQCTARYGPTSVLGQQYENLAHIELTLKASHCHPQLVTVNRPLLKKEMSPRISQCYNCGGCRMKLKQN